MGDTLLIESPDRGTKTREGEATLYALALRTHNVRELAHSTDHLSQCTLSADQRQAACVRQNTMMPPDPAVIDLGSGRVRTVATLNPEFHHIQLGEVTRLQWQNRYGDVTTGYLTKPVGYVPGKRYPLLVIWYGFEGEFITNAEWITSYPTQAFAREGFAVLMMNYPRTAFWERGDFTAAAIRQGYSALASMEEGVRTLVRGGLADSARLGIMGWSHGGFITALTISHSTAFRAASIGDGGTKYEPGEYFSTDWSMRQYDELLFGGPPLGSTLQNWLAFSPVLNAHRVRAPVLLEFNPVEATNGVELFYAFRRTAPTEFVVYPGEHHIFEQPVHRLASMQRNLDWFAFWLQDRTDPNPAKADQYARWCQMQNGRDSSVGAGVAPTHVCQARNPAPRSPGL